MHFLLLFIFSAAASNFSRCEALMRSPRPPPRRAHLFLFTICGLFTKKFELYFKGSPSTSSGQARECPHPLAATSSRSPARLWRGRRPRKKSVRTSRKSDKIFCLKKMQKFKRTCIKMAQPVESERIASYCPIAPLKNAIQKLLTPI